MKFIRKIFGWIGIVAQLSFVSVAFADIIPGTLRRYVDTQVDVTMSGAQPGTLTDRRTVDAPAVGAFDANVTANQISPYGARISGTAQQRSSVVSDGIFAELSTRVEFSGSSSPQSISVHAMATSLFELIFTVSDPGNYRLSKVFVSECINHPGTSCGVGGQDEIVDVQLTCGDSPCQPSQSVAGVSVIKLVDGKPYTLRATLTSTINNVTDRTHEGRWYVLLEPDKVEPLSPILAGLSVRAAFVGSSTDVSLTLRGARFNNDSVVHWNGFPRATTFLSEHELIATIPAADLTQNKTANITVVNQSQPADRNTSETLPFTVRLPSAATADFDGDRKTDISIWRPSAGTWHHIRSSDSAPSTTQFGQAGDVAVSGDYDGDGKVDIAVYRSSPGPICGAEWHLLRSTEGYTVVPYGCIGDIPVAGDYDGDGRADLAVYRPSSSTWFIQSSSNGQSSSTLLGQAGDVPVPGDYDGDGKTDIALYRPSAGTWYVRQSSDNTLQTFQLGQVGDLPAPADYDGDGKTDAAVFRPSSGTWFIKQTSAGLRVQNSFGQAGDVPAPGNYNGNGGASIAVFRPSTGVWYLLQSSGSFLSVAYGQPGDVAVPAGPSSSHP